MFIKSMKKYVFSNLIEYLDLKDLKKEFTHAFKDADKVILFPIYTAGEKIKLGFSYLNFAKEIIKNSKVKLFLVDDKFQLAKYIKK